ncbi:TonB-dependent receptor plug domain-containing protein [Flavobacterium granuli]|uniref:Iron complex outermembrane recepter protein n=1 Tax=Flavobacterium granuli TaxID=280093 RepID=A0A1M5IYR8_9FLAO|nr:TonB-dependent receptor [Flavobacterium granuli]PRZ28167.1 iron complex outermembrane receptor protein [Flavobacterium granuli]SHG33508.1 iron complex outermembrane recepter protein [Flavobacterium granuli]
MTAKKLLLLSIVLSCQFILAQNKVAIPLNEVVVSDNQLKNFSSSQSVQKLNDSIISKNQSSLTSLLNYTTAIYFKENGLGMVSSPSFRGTTSQQTVVVWNGININSQLLGQTDFNTVSTREFNSIDVKAGGGSVVYGSGAIGGTIHLNNELKFADTFKNSLQVYYGDFNSLSAIYGLTAATNKWSANASFTRNSSDNDFKFIGKEGRNTNGQYYNNSLNTALGYKLNAKNSIKFYSQIYDGERHFSLTSLYATKTKYEDYNSRNLLTWTSFIGKSVSNVKLAFITEHYKYFEDIESKGFSSGGVKSLIAKYDFAYQLSPKMNLNAILDYTKNKGLGSGIGENTREIGGLSMLFQQSLSQDWNYEISARKEVSDVYKSPVVFSAGSTYDFSEIYRLKFNFSRNYRIPTFNDLYWQGSGNPDLKPENSYQAEVGNQFRYRDFRLNATVYATKIDDMIRWLPNNFGNWSPVNTDKVSIYGAEALLGWNKKWAAHFVDFNGTYAYTVSLDDKNDKQLFYVPYHKITASSSYSYKKWNAYYQFMFTGEVFTTSDNNPKYILSDYTVSNFGMDYNFSQKNVCKIGFKIANLWNEKYEALPSRIMPGRNLTLYLNLNY